MPMKNRLTTLTESIAQEEARLARLDAERTAIINRIGELRDQLSAIEAESTPPPKHSTLSSAEKIVLFSSLFRGRGDVFPKLWISRAGDRKGYMPACVNDGNYSLCGKRKTPRIKCSDC